MLITPFIKIQKKPDHLTKSSSRSGLIGANDENHRTTEYVTKFRYITGPTKAGKNTSAGEAEMCPY